jgi:cytochrome c oxidase cbb3-type subunit III
MSGFWSGWVIFLVVLNLGITLFLFLWGLRIRIPTQPDGTSGHVWAHGVLREGVRKLPLWWIIFSACMFIIGFAYLALYPGFGGYKGLLGWTSQGELQRDAAANDAKLAILLERWRPLDLQQLAMDADAVRIGHRLYLDNCAACHGALALGNQVVGAPNLTDDDWLHGGDNEAILASILDGRGGTMPPLGPVLGHEGVNEAAAYVLSLNGVQSPEGWAAAGKTRFETVCVACHGIDGRGNAALGTPDLTDAVWLYGGDFRSVAASIRDGRSGAMPAWRERLGIDQARLVAAWVISRRSAAVPAEATE